jgi:hypothetical protein
LKHKFLVVLLFAVSLLSSSALASAQSKHAQWTVMIYVAADNNLEPNSIINLMEMAAVGSTKDVNIVAQVTRPPDYKGFYGEWGGTRRFLVTKSDGGVSSGDFEISPTRFADFVTSFAAQGAITPDQVAQIKRASKAEQEQAALQMSIPVIDTQTPLTPLQLQNVQDLGAQVNSGDGATLADFGTWAVQNYPADHYGLVMWDHGGGWSMIASDDTFAPAGIHMPDFQKALDTITQAAHQKFDFVGFDACLMSQLAVAATIAPYANYQIAAEELVPGFGWDYTPPLAALVANPAIPMPDFGKTEVNAFDTLYSITEKDAAESYDLGVLDLSKAGDVVKALDAFDAAVKASPDDEIKAIGTARSNVQLFGSVGESQDQTDSISSVDLVDFMRLMINLSKDEKVKQSAKSVMDAVSKMVLYHKASKTLPHANGLSIFFPPDRNTFTSLADGERYRQEFGQLLPSWQGFLDTFYGTAANAAQGSKLGLHITGVSTTQTPGSIHDTPVITYNLDGQNIVDVTANILYQIDAQTNVVLDTFPIVSDITTEDGSQVNEYPDGQSINDFYWNAKIPSLSDGKNDLLVLMTTNPKDEQHGFIQGTYTNAVTGKQTTAWLLIDLETYQSGALWAAQDQANTVAQVFPKPGDTFEPAYVLLDNAGKSQVVSSGKTLIFGKDPLQVTDAPGPDGKYTVIIQATDAAGTGAVDVAAVDVQNSGLDPNLQGFKDLSFGLTFLYPASWTDVSTYQRADGLDELYVTDVTGDIYLSVVNYTEATTLDDVSNAMQDDLNSIDGVQIGDETPAQVGNLPGTSVSYQYTDDNGTLIEGIAVAVYAPDTQQGYVLKIEAPTDKADEAKTAFDEVLSSSQFFAPAQ